MEDREFRADDAMMMTAGVAAWALNGALMTMLNEKGLLSRLEGIAVIDHALSSLERLSAVGIHPLMTMARDLLEREMAAWSETALPAGSADTQRTQ